jgi:hypothetical protein
MLFAYSSVFVRNIADSDVTSDCRCRFAQKRLTSCLRVTGRKPEHVQRNLSASVKFGDRSSMSLKQQTASNRCHMFQCVVNAIFILYIET